MVLRRTLPSRLTGAPLPEGGDVAARVVKPTDAAAAPGSAASSVTPETSAPVAVASAKPSQAAALAAAAAQAFAPPVLEAAATQVTPAPRVLEESFKASAAAAPVAPLTPTAEPVAAMSVPAVASSSVAETKPPVAELNAAPKFETPAAPTPMPDVVQPEPKPELKAEPQPQAAPQLVAQSAAQPKPEASRPGGQAGGQLRRRVTTSSNGGGNSASMPAVRPQAVATKSEAKSEAKPEAKPEFKPENKPAPKPEAPVAPRIVLPVPEKPAPVAPIAAAPEPQAAPRAEPAAAPMPEAPRKPRTVEARDFAAATVAAPAAPQTPAPKATSALAPEIPVDTRPLDKVDEELIASGIMNGPQGDTLTNALPGGFAVSMEETPLTTMGGDYRLATGTVPPPSTAGGLPWQTEPLGSGGWQLDAPTPPPDVFKPQTAGGAMVGLEGGNTRIPPPVLPDARPSRNAMNANGRSRSSWLGTGITVAALGAIGFYVWNQYGQQGGLEQAKQQLAQFAEPGPRLAELAGVSPTESGLLPPPSYAVQSSPTGATQIGFLDPASDTNAPITGGTETPMPEDISLFAKLQKAIQAEREKAGSINTTANNTTSATAPGEALNAAAEESNTPLTKEQVTTELEAYSKALNENPENPPRPREFFRDPSAFMDGNAAPVASGNTLLPPPAGKSERASASQELPPPAELYTNNPNNLPIVSEPMGAQAPRIRQLQDFAAELMAPEERRVKIPQGVRPRLSATDFPSLDVLSFVPGKGVVATADGREGVLLIGESINGWELTQVTGDLAEFRAGGRSYYVSAQN